MRISNIQSDQTFRTFGSAQKQKREFIDVIVDNVKNPRDINDCVAVPRGIFKAYIYLMAGSGLMTISSLLPQKIKPIKTGLSIVGAVLNIISAVYFAKPFAINGLSPTVKKDVNLNK